MQAKPNFIQRGTKSLSELQTRSARLPYFPDSRPLDSFSQPQVRDLAWILFSPSLYLNSQQHHPPVDADLEGLKFVEDGEAHEWWHASQSWLRSLNNDPSPLLTFLDTNKSNLLGTYFAALFEYFMRHGPCSTSFPNLKTSLQVFADKVTLGEMDAVYCGKDMKSLVHLELSIKYKAYVPPSSPAEPPFELASFVGPHFSETAQDKLKKLSKQLRLSRIESGLDVLRREYGLSFTETSIQRLCLVRGYLCYPFQSWLKDEGAARLDQSSESWINPAHLRGWWTTDIEEVLLARPDSCWMLLTLKTRWLAFHLREYSQSTASTTTLPPGVIDGNQLREQLKEIRSKAGSHLRRHRVLIAELRREQSQSISVSTSADSSLRPIKYRECSRGFVLEADWLDKARAFIHSRRIKV